MRALLFLFFASFALIGTAAEPRHLKLYAVDGKFEDVKQDVDLAIEARGFKAERALHIGEMLARTGRDAGAAREVFLAAEAIQFCPSALSRRVMEADPSNIVFCPYTIFVYALPGAPKKVYVGYRRLAIVGAAASQAALRDVETMLDSIVREAINLK